VNHFELKTLVHVLDHLGEPWSELPYGVRDLIELDLPRLAKAWDQLTIEQHREALRSHVVKRIEGLHLAIGFHEDDAEESGCLRRELALAHDIIEKLHAQEVDRTSSAASIPSSNQNAVGVNVNLTVILPPSAATSQLRGPGEVEADFQTSRAPDEQAGDNSYFLGSDTNQQIIDAPSSVGQQEGAPAPPKYDAESAGDASTPAAGSTTGTTSGGDLVAPDPDLQSQFDAEKWRRMNAGDDHEYDAMTLWARHHLRVDTDTSKELWEHRSNKFSRKAGRPKGKR
jgi:hypothetical protein